MNRGRPRELNPRSKNITVRVDDDILKDLTEQAKEQNLSVSSLVYYILTDWFKSSKQYS